LSFSWRNSRSQFCKSFACALSSAVSILGTPITLLSQSLEITGAAAARFPYRRQPALRGPLARVWLP
jgi:hypothetical protein